MENVGHAPYPLLLSLLLAACVHDEVDLGDFTFDCDPDVPESCDNGAAGGPGDADGAGEVSEEDGPVGTDDGDDHSEDSADGGDGDGGGEPGDDDGGDDDGGDDGDDGSGEVSCWETDCAQGEYCGDDGVCAALGDNVCADPASCLDECPDEEQDCGTQCVQDTPEDDRFRLLTMLGCNEECAKDPWCFTNLCEDEQLACHSGVEAEDPGCVAAIFCHFVCGEVDTCHQECSSWGEDVEPNIDQWRRCMAQSCEGEGDCEGNGCEHLMVDCMNEGFRGRCDEWCRDELQACEQGPVDVCLEACELAAWNGSRALECVRDQGVEDSCDEEVMSLCVQRAREMQPPDDGGNDPGPHPGDDLHYEHILFEDFSGGAHDSWEEYGGVWDLEERALVKTCEGCPQSFAILQLDHDVPTQMGFLQLSFTASLAADPGASAIWVALHRALDAGRPEQNLDRIIGARMSTTDRGLSFWSSGQGVRGPDAQVDVEYEREREYEVRISCYGGYGAEISLFPAEHGSRPLARTWRNEGCEVGPDRGQARLLVGGLPNAWADNIRLDLLPCNSDGPPLVEQTGPCGRVAWWPLADDTNEAVQGWDPEAEPDGGIEIHDQDGRQGAFFSGHDDPLKYYRPPGAGSSEWAVDMWVRPHDPPENPDALRRRMLFDDYLDNDQGQESGRRIYLNEDNNLVCEAFGDGDPASATVLQGLGWDEWTWVGCTWDGSNLTAWLDGEPTSVPPNQFTYVPSRGQARLGDHADPEQWQGFRGWMSDVRMYGTSKSQEYFRPE